MTDKKVLLLGDADTWQWHPMASIRPLMEALTAAGYACDVMTHYGALTPARLGGHRVVVNYVDNWGACGSPAAEKALLDWLAAGGRLVSIHNGLILPDAPALQRVHGAAFTKHDPARPLTLTLNETGRALFGPLAPYTQVDEPYEFEEIAGVDKEVFWHYTRDGEARLWPAGWRTVHGQGQLWYFAPGHTAQAMAQPGYIAMLLRCIEDGQDQKGPIHG